MASNEFILPDDSRVPFQGVPPAPGDLVFLDGEPYVIDGRAVYAWRTDDVLEWRVWIRPRGPRDLSHPIDLTSPGPLKEGE